MTESFSKLISHEDLICRLRCDHGVASVDAFHVWRIAGDNAESPFRTAKFDVLDLFGIGVNVDVYDAEERFLLHVVFSASEMTISFLEGGREPTLVSAPRGTAHEDAAAMLRTAASVRTESIAGKVST